MCKNPRAFGFSGAGLAASPEPEECTLIVSCPSAEAASSTAPARAAAVLALVARAIRHHEHAAFGAGGRTFMRVSLLQRGVSCRHRRRRNGGLHHRRKKLNWRKCCGVFAGAG